MSFIRVAAAAPRVILGNCQKNAESIQTLAEMLEGSGVQAAVFPELSLTGATCQDLYWQPDFQRQAVEALLALAKRTGDMIVMVGLPLTFGGKLYNCAAVLQKGRILGVVPKASVACGGSSYEGRWFESGRGVSGSIKLGECEVPFGMNQLFDAGVCTFGVELGEDCEGCLPPSARYAAAGAEVVFNLSAPWEAVTRYERRLSLLCAHTARCALGYVYAGAGYGESTNDLVFGGTAWVLDEGRLLAEGERFNTTGSATVADIDLQRIRYQRQRRAGFFEGEALPRIATEPLKLTEGPLMHALKPMPFIPSEQELDERCRELTNIQVTGLRTRLEATGLKKLVVGVSGGLDSTLALLVAARCFEQMGRPVKDIMAITMPGFGTGKRTRSNAVILMEALGVTALEIPIGPAVKQHFADIGQDETVHDVTYENAQARERTQILMDYANKVGGLVLGTGDLSESALGFATYNGDHMSMYNVNASVPKTLIRTLVAWLGEESGSETIARVCGDINATPISPELLPVTEGELNQRTEDILGDYALHDFFLYHLMTSGSGRERLRRLALQAFKGVYDEAAVDKALSLFLRRFYQQQFKRTCIPDGPKVGSVSLSPRGDLRLPSDIDWKGFI